MDDIRRPIYIRIDTRCSPSTRPKAIREKKKNRACHVAASLSVLARLFMCHAAVADSGEHHGRRRLADGGGGGGAAGRHQQPPQPVMMETATATASSSAAAALLRSRQARETSAMVAALARVVSGAAPPAKTPLQGAAAVQEASTAEEPWWPSDELVAEPSSAFVLDGKNRMRHFAHVHGQKIFFFTHFPFLNFPCLSKG